MTERKFYEDGFAILNGVKNELHCNYSDLILHGFSLGGAVASYVAAKLAERKAIQKIHGNESKLYGLEYPKVSVSGKGSCKRISDAPSSMLRLLENSVVKHPTAVKVVPFPICPEDYNMDSMIHISESGEPDSIILLKDERCCVNGEIEGDVIRVAWLYSNDPKGGALLELLSAVVPQLKKQNPRSTLIFASLNQQSFELAHKLFPDANYEPFSMAFLNLENLTNNPGGEAPDDMAFIFPV
ncbi:MAG: hypothetical protein K5985_04335 [Lachnospiraceae bacterium]|nr:hypothetical protein [Lachnospiraceae bacterium]